LEPNETAILTDPEGVALVIRDGKYRVGVFVKSDADLSFPDNPDRPYTRGEHLIAYLYGTPSTTGLTRESKPYTITVNGKELRGYLYSVEGDAT
jgi:hypothetical protein